MKANEKQVSPNSSQPVHQRLEMNPETEGGAQLKDNRPEVQQHKRIQAAANSSPQVSAIAQLQTAANQSQQTPVQRETGDETESVGSTTTTTTGTGAIPAHSGDTGPDPTVDEDGYSHASSIDPELGADSAQLTGFRATFVQANQQLQLAEQDAATLNLVLQAIHREYGQWFSNANTGADAAAKAAQFTELENDLIGGVPSGGKFWCVVAGMETAKQDMAILLAGIRADFEGIASHFQSALSAVQESPSTGMTYAEGLMEYSMGRVEEMLDERHRTLILKSEAEALLESGRTKFGGKTATAPVVMDKDYIAEARAAQGSTDPSISLHQNDGPALAMKALKSAMVEYVEATREKEELRSEFGVSKLKKVSKATKREDPGVEGRIAEARRKKAQAKEKFKSVRTAVDAMLSEGLAPEVAAEIAEIDRTYLGVTAEEADGHLDHVEADRLGKKDKAKTLGKVTDQLIISEANYARLRRSIEPIASAGVGAKTFAMNLGVNFSLGVGKGSEIKIGGGIKYSGSTNIQDDRRLRVTHSFGVYGSGSAELAGVVGTGIGAELMRGKTEVFMDADHWASTMAYRFSQITKEIKTLDDTQKLVEEELGPEDSERVLATSRLAEDGVTNVKSTALSGSIEASALGIGVSGSYEKKWMEFSKAGEDKKKQATQTTKSASLSIGNGSVTVTRTIIDGHANPDNDGQYWNIGLSMEGKASASFTAFTEESGDPEYGEWEQRIRSILGTDPSPTSGDSPSFTTAEQSMASSVKSAHSDGHFGDIVKALTDYLGAEVLKIEASMPASFDATVGLSGSKSCSVQWNWVKSDSGKNELQYRRFDKGGSRGISGSVPVGTVGAASVGVEAGVSKGTSTMISETLGTDTLTYFLTVFNGLNPRTLRDRRVGKDSTPDQWSVYCDKHRKQVWMLLCKMGAQEGGGYAELQAAMRASEGMATDSDAEVVSKAAATREAAQALLDATQAQLATADPSTMDASKYAIVKAALTNYFAKQGDLNNYTRKSEWE